MKPILNYRSLQFIIFLLILSCTESCHNDKQHPVASEKVIAPDTNFIKLRSFFIKDSTIKQDEKPEIPFALISTFYKGEDSLREEYHHPINPLDVFENKYGTFFIVEIGCAAGGFCSTFDLLVFSKEGSFIGREYLGSNAGDLGFSEYVNYKSVSDTTLLVDRSTYDTPEEKETDSDETNVDSDKQKLTDSATYLILLDTSYYTKNYWLKSKDK